MAKPQHQNLNTWQIFMASSFEECIRFLHKSILPIASGFAVHRKRCMSAVIILTRSVFCPCKQFRKHVHLADLPVLTGYLTQPSVKSFGPIFVVDHDYSTLVTWGPSSVLNLSTKLSHFQCFSSSQLNRSLYRIILLKLKGADHMLTFVTIL